MQFSIPRFPLNGQILQIILRKSTYLAISLKICINTPHIVELEVKNL